MDDYVRRRRELDKEVKEYQSPRKPKQGEPKQKRKIEDQLGTPETSQYDYSLLSVPQSKFYEKLILW